MRWIKRLELEILWPFYTSQIIQSIFILTTAYWVVYFLSIGYSLVQISFLPIVMLLTSFVMELPTGFLADIRGRKWSVVTALFLEAVAVAFIPFVGLQFEMLIILYVLMGIGTAFASGASEAWVVDLLHWHTKSNAIPSYYAILHSFINIGFIVAPLFASVIFFLIGELHYLWWIEGAMIFVAGLILCMFGEEKRAEHNQHKLTITLLYQKTMLQFRERPELLFMVIVMFFFAIIFGITTFAWQPFLQTKGVPVVWFGVLFAFTGVLAIAYPFIQKSIFSRIGNRRLLQFISIIQMIAFSLLAITPIVGVIILFFIIQNFDSIKMPIFQPWFQEHVLSVVRSISGSIIAMVGVIGESVGYLLVGQLAERLGFNVIWWFAAGLCALIVVVLIFARRIRGVCQIFRLGA
ncbi:MFS transporter [Candidatus Falkowbacteria bacterium]|nr:MFS transporter [Candidatus Falkowbacteria bacterium]